MGLTAERIAGVVDGGKTTAKRVAARARSRGTDIVERKLDEHDVETDEIRGRVIDELHEQCETPLERNEFAAADGSRRKTV